MFARSLAPSRGVRLGDDGMRFPSVSLPYMCPSVLSHSCVCLQRGRLGLGEEVEVTAKHLAEGILYVHIINIK